MPTFSCPFFLYKTRSGVTGFLANPYTIFLAQLLYNFYNKLFSIFTDPDDPYKLLDDTRALGLVVCRGTSVVLICPMDGMEAIPNPFITQEG